VSLLICHLFAPHAIIAQMGFSSWNAIGSQVNAAYIKKVAQYFVDSGLQEKVRADLTNLPQLHQAGL
jgi:hypothetical protein